MLKKKLDERKILLVLVCKDRAEAEQQVEWITKSNLEIPQNFQMSVNVIVGPKNLAASFNDVQKKDDSKYKIYITSPVVFFNKSLIVKMIESFFLEPKTGLVGIIGSELPVSGDYTQARNFYGIYNYVDENGAVQNYLGKDPLYYQSVHIVDGNFFATNEDFAWDEKIGDDFVVAAQCLNFRNKGYDVGVVYQENPFVIFVKDEFSYNPKVDQQNYKKQLEKFNLLYGKKIQPLVSILIPTYNQPKFCQEALESALAQTYKNIEILVGDDSTNEDTKKMISPYLKKNPNLKYFYHDGKIPRGGGANMFFLLNHCSGNYVNYLLHDDLFHPEKISKMMNYYIADFENEIGMVTSARSLIDENGKFVERKNPWQPRTDTIISGNDVGRRLLFILANFIGELTTVLFKKNDVMLKNSPPDTPQFSVGGFCEFYSRSYGDMDTWLEILKSGKKLIFISESLSSFRKHAAQNTYNPNTRITLPLDALNFVTVAWLNDAFFKNVEEFYYCLDKWPIMADRWFVPIAESDEEIIKKRKHWIIKLREILLTRDRAKMTDAAISYLLECIPNYGFRDFLIRKNNKGLWEKNKVISYEDYDLDEKGNTWNVFGTLSISKKNAKFNKALQVSPGNYIITNNLTFGGADFTIDLWCYMDSTTPRFGVFLHCTSNSNVGNQSYENCIFLSRNDLTDALMICACDENGDTLLENKFQEISPTVPMLGTLRHYEIDYKFDTQTIYLFADGDLKYSKSGVNINRVARYVILGLNNIGRHFSLVGAISEFRLLDGKCEHTANFTPPTEKYEIDEHTLSLLHFD